MKRHYAFEVVRDVQAATKRADKIDLLNSNKHTGIFGILVINFDDSVQFTVNLEPTLRRRKENDFIITLPRALKSISQFYGKTGADANVVNNRWISLLEDLEPREAEILLQAARKEIKLGLSAATILKTFKLKE